MARSHLFIHLLCSKCPSVCTPFLCPLQPHSVWAGASRLRLLLLRGAGIPRWSSQLDGRRGAGLRDFTAAKTAEVDHDAVRKAYKLPNKTIYHKRHHCTMFVQSRWRVSVPKMGGRLTQDEAIMSIQGVPQHKTTRMR